jgi:hypothetical protein
MVNPVSRPNVLQASWLILEMSGGSSNHTPDKLHFLLLHVDFCSLPPGGKPSRRLNMCGVIRPPRPENSCRHWESRYKQMLNLNEAEGK